MDVILWVLTYAPLFLLIISAVITVHELGHYWVGRLFGAAVESFAIGFGKPIWEKRDGRGTRWRINWLPLGGFVKFVGEMQLPQDVGAQTPETVETEAEARRIAETLPKPKAAKDGVETTFYDNQILVGRPYRGNASPCRSAARSPTSFSLSWLLAFSASFTAFRRLRKST